MKLKRLQILQQLHGVSAGLFAILLLALPVQAASGIPPGITLKKASDNPLFKTDGEGKLILPADPDVLGEGDTLYVYAGQGQAPRAEVSRTRPPRMARETLL